MLSLRPVEYTTISPHMQDYQSKSKNFEMPPEGAEFLGIYRGEEFIGYFITVGYDFKVLEINQGYLIPEARHKNLSRVSMQLLEDLARKAGYEKIVLSTNRAVGSYVQFMKSMSYGLEKAIFAKRLK